MFACVRACVCVSPGVYPQAVPDCQICVITIFLSQHGSAHLFISPLRHIQNQTHTYIHTHIDIHVAILTQRDGSVDVSRSEVN